MNNIDPDLQVHILSAVYGSKISLSPLRRVLANLGIEHGTDDSLPQLRRKLKKYIMQLRRGKNTERSQRNKEDEATRHKNELDFIRQAWPQLVPQSLKNKILVLFRETTSSEALSTFTCAACAESAPLRSHCSMSIGDPSFDLNLLKRPNLKSDESLLLDQYKWLHPDCVPPPMPFDDGPLRDILVDRDGVSLPLDGGQPSLSLCKSCHSSLKNGRTPALALANRTFLGPVPNELKGLTIIEEAMIARCRSKCWIIKLKEENQDLELQNTQRGIHGHIIIYPQQPSKIAEILPPSVEEITE
jgi:hypothetical protein